MDFYAFNVAPIAGWQTQFGSGSVALALNLAGTSANVKLGRGTVPMALALNGIAVPVKLGSGSVAMAMAINGLAVPVKLGAGHVDMALALSDSSVSPIAVRGAGLIDMLLELDHDIPLPGTIPPGFLKNTRERTFDYSMADDGRAWTVPSETRRFTVPPDADSYRLDKASRDFHADTKTRND